MSVISPWLPSARRRWATIASPGLASNTAPCRGIPVERSAGARDVLQYAVGMPNPPGGQAPYPQVDQQADYPRLEEQVLEYWAKDGTFAASVEARAGGPNEYVFYDGPPFANGLPHYGHLLTGFVKDAVPRYQTMRGRRVERRFGWDCHGLPAEMEAEKELEVSGRAGIVEYGIDHFNEYCRTLVQRTTDAWERYVTRQARWVDFANDYKTMDLSYMESVMWAFKTLWEKGLLYEGDRVLPYCWECETPLSNFETRQDDAYRPRQDPAVTVVFTLDADESAAQPGRRLGPAAAAGVDDDTVDAAVQPGPRRRSRRRVRRLRAPRGAHRHRRRARRGLPGALRRGRASGPLPGLGPGGSHLPPAVPVLRRPPRRLPGARRGLRRHRRGHRRRPHGSGVRRGGLRPLPRGRHRRGVPRRRPRPASRARSRPTPGSSCSTPTPRSSPTSRRRARWWRPRRTPTATPTAGAPTPRSSTRRCARGSWRSPPSRTACSSSTSRSTGSRRTSKTAPSASGSKGRATGRSAGTGSGGRPSRCGRATTRAHPRTDVYGSVEELERDFGVRLTDLHRPAIDELVRPNPDDPSGRSTMRRVTDVLDCWFESGSMPFAQVHYPFERAEWFESPLPGRLHRRVREPDPGLVLHAARARHRALRPAAVPTLRGARHRARRRRPQDVEAPGELPRARHGLRRVGSRRHALVPAVVADPAGTGPRGPRQGDRGGATPGPEPDLERLVLPVAVRQRGRHPGPAPDRRHRRPRPLHPGQDGVAGRRRHGVDGRLRPLRGVLGHHPLPRRPQQLVHPAQPGPVLAGPGRLGRGRVRQGGRLRHLVDGPRDAVQGLGSPAAPADRDRCTGG